MVQRTERKCGLCPLDLDRAIPTAGARAWGRRGVDEGLVAKRRLSGRDVVEEFVKATTWESDGGGSIVMVS
jgi:hypothetical protein